MSALYGVNRAFQMEAVQLLCDSVAVIALKLEQSQARGEIRTQQVEATTLMVLSLTESYVLSARVLGQSKHAIEKQAGQCEASARATQELQVDCLLVGTRGYSLGQRVRRVLRLASCPVMIVSHPREARRRDLVAWYEQAVQRSLPAHPGALAVLTSREAARRFAPPMTMMVGRAEAEEAVHALERLARAASSFGIRCMASHALSMTEQRLPTVAEREYAPKLSSQLRAQRRRLFSLFPHHVGKPRSACCRHASPQTRTAGRSRFLT